MNTLTCVYCGMAYPEGTPPHGAKVLTDHIKICPKHPLRAAEQKIEQLRESLRQSNRIIHDHVVTMQAALIDAMYKQPVDGLRWIYNALAGPGNLPDPGDKYADNAEHYYNFHRSDAFGPCDICGLPACYAGGRKVGCCEHHFHLSKHRGLYRRMWE